MNSKYGLWLTLGTVVSIINQKGGVGKTTLTFNIAKGIASFGKRILVIDNDPQANLTSCFLGDQSSLPPAANIIKVYEELSKEIQPLKVFENIFLLGSDIHLAKIIEKGMDVIYTLKEGMDIIKNGYDFVLIDCLPAFGYLNLAALNAAEYVLIPTKPSPFSLAGLKDLFDNINKVKSRMNISLDIIGIVLNLVEGKNTKMAIEIEGALRYVYPEYVFKNTIKKGIKLEESPSLNMSIMEYDPKSKDSSQFKVFLDEFLDRLGMLQSEKTKL